MKRLARRPALLVLALCSTVVAAGGPRVGGDSRLERGDQRLLGNAHGKLRAVDAAGDCTGGETAIALGGPTRGYVHRPAGTVVVGTTSADVASLRSRRAATSSTGS